MKKAQDIGSNAIRLVNDFFLFGIRDDVINHKSKFPFVSHDEEKWTLTDLDRALNEMGGNKRSIDEVEIKTVDRLQQYQERKLKYINGLGFSFQQVFRYLHHRRLCVGVMIGFERFCDNKSCTELKEEAADLLSRVRSVFYGVDSK